MILLLLCVVLCCTAFPTEFPIDPELTLDFVGIANRWDYICEAHTVTTDDGYILTVHRLPAKQFSKTPPTVDRPVVFVQHGLEGSSASWALNLPNESAAFVFADAGFDVWLGNFRGNVYSKLHKTLDPKSHEFWQFSWDQMASQDLPAMINYVTTFTNTKQLYYVAHSMGTMTAFAEFSRNSALEQKIKEFYAFGPVASVSHIEGLLRWMADKYQFIEFLLEIFGEDEFLPPDDFTRFIAEDLCEDKDTYKMCDNLVMLISGKESGQMNDTRVPIYINHTPSGTSTRTMIHFAQNVKDSKFQMYDFDSAAENMKHYGQTSPPQYNVATMNVPVRLWWGFNDTLADPEDIQTYLIPNLRNLRSEHGLDGFSHIDFNWGMKAAEMVYHPVIELINKDFKGN